RDRLRKNFYAVGLPVAQYHGQVFRTILVCQALNDSLVLEVHRTCGGSNEEFGRLEDDFVTGAFEALGNHRARHAVALADGDDFFSFEHSTSVNFHSVRPKTSSRPTVGSF